MLQNKAPPNGALKRMAENFFKQKFRAREVKKQSSNDIAAPDSIKAFTSHLRDGEICHRTRSHDRVMYN